MQTYIQQSIDSATLVQLVDDALGNYYYRTEQGQACWAQRQELSEEPHSPSFTPSLAVPMGQLVNVMEPQTNTQTRVYSQRVDLEQFQLIEEDGEEGESIPHDVPRITEADLDNRFGGDNGSSGRTDNFDREYLHIVAEEFLYDPTVAAIEMPQLLDLGQTQETIQYKLTLLKKRPSISKTELFYLILDPRITDPFKKAFARFFEFHLDNYMPIAAEQSKKLKKLSTFIRHHRSVTAYLRRLRPQCALSTQCRSYNN